VKRDELDPERAKLLKRIHKLPQTASKTIIAIDDNRIHAPLSTRDEKRIQLWPTLFST
jgi:hypothetical protein